MDFPTTEIVAGTGGIQDGSNPGVKWRVVAPSKSLHSNIIAKHRKAQVPLNPTPKHEFSAL